MEEFFMIMLMLCLFSHFEISWDPKMEIDKGGVSLLPTESKGHWFSIFFPPIVNVWGGPILTEIPAFPNCPLPTSFSQFFYLIFHNLLYIYIFVYNPHEFLLPQ